MLIYTAVLPYVLYDNAAAAVPRGHRTLLVARVGRGVAGVFSFLELTQSGPSAWSLSSSAVAL